MYTALETPTISIYAILEEIGPEDEPLGGGGNYNGRLGKVLVGSRLQYAWRALALQVPCAHCLIGGFRPPLS